MENWLDRTENLIGTDALKKLQSSHVAVFGCGGVGSYVVEALVRSGIGNITLIDNDIVDITNINRQLIADVTTIGKYKVDVEKERILKINPNLKVTTFQEFFSLENSPKLLNFNYDYVVDAIDSISSKLTLIEYTIEKNIPIISSMGTGNKLDPNKFEITDLSKTSVCPLAKKIRKELGKKGIKHVKVLYSKEAPIKQETNTISSISFVPSVAGLLIAGEVVKDLIITI